MDRFGELLLITLPYYYSLHCFVCFTENLRWSARCNTTRLLLICLIVPQVRLYGIGYLVCAAVIGLKDEIRVVSRCGRVTSTCFGWLWIAIGMNERTWVDFIVEPWGLHWRRRCKDLGLFRMSWVPSATTTSTSRAVKEEGESDKEDYNDRDSCSYHKDGGWRVQ